MYGLGNETQLKRRSIASWGEIKVRFAVEQAWLQALRSCQPG